MNDTRISKFLSLVLRHKPDTIGLTLDVNGWANVKDLLSKMNLINDKKITIDDLKRVVAENNKKRFVFNENETKIRANQGHSINVNLGLKEIKPPDVLYHGTGQKYLDSIKKTGIQKQNRQYVHLSDNTETAINVGRRHGNCVVITLNTLDMYKNGYKFYKSENDVWLTDMVPSIYFSKISYYG